jgi:hypothetical protein
VGEVLDAAIKIYRSNAADLMKAVLLVVAPVQVLSALVRISGTSSDILHTTSSGLPGGPTSVEFDAPALIGLVVATVAVILLTVVAWQLATGAALKAVSGAYLGDRPDWRQSLRFAFDHLGPLLWLALLHGVLVLLGFLACAVPGVYLAAAWAVAVPALLLEDHRGLAALRRSRHLVRGRWGPTFVLLLLVFLVAGVVQAVLTGLLMGVASGGGDASRAVLSAIAAAASSTLTTPFIAAVTLVLYFDLRVRREGFDLELLARRVGIEPAGGAGGGGAGWTRPAPEDDRPPFWPPPPGWRPRG